MGMQVEAEYHTSNGRIDLTILTDKYIYLFEFKLNVGTPKGLQQIAPERLCGAVCQRPAPAVLHSGQLLVGHRGIDDWQPHYNE